MGLFDTTPSGSTLEKAAYCALYEIIKEGVDNIEDLKSTLKECVGQCETLPKEERKELKPVYQKAYEISCNYSFKKIKELTKQVGSDYSKEF